MRSKLSGKLQRGTPTKYRAEYAEEYKRLRMIGVTDDQFALLWHVANETIWSWTNANEEFAKAKQESATQADALIERNLFHRALGYCHPEEVVFKTKDDKIIRATITKHYPPDVTACIFWLKNRQPDKWRDREKNQTRQRLEEIERALGIAREETGRVPQIINEQP